MILNCILALTTQASAISYSHFSSSNVFFHYLSYYQIVVFHNTIAEWTFHSCSACFSIQFFIHLSVSFIVKLSLKTHLGGPKYYIHIKNMLQIISSLLLVLISLAAEYLVDVSIKCRIQYWLYSCSFKSRHMVWLNLFLKVNPTGQRRGLLNHSQTE